MSVHVPVARTFSIAIVSQTVGLETVLNSNWHYVIIPECKGENQIYKLIILKEIILVLWDVKQPAPKIMCINRKKYIVQNKCSLYNSIAMEGKKYDPAPVGWVVKKNL